jgi:hypothetical protein
MAELTTDRVFDRILKECKREAEKCVKEEITELRAANKRLQKERDDAVKAARANMDVEVKELERDLLYTQKEAQFAEKNGAYFEEQVCYWFDDEMQGVLENLKDIATRTLKMKPEVLKRARTQRDAIDARYKKLVEKAKKK